ncbi:MAG: DUF2961 domain-containing protein [Armatimonadota bacterium]
MHIPFPVKPLALLGLSGALVGFAAVAPAPLAAAETSSVSTRSLLTELTDLRGMAEFPAPQYSTGQFSSHDRRSTSAADHEGWFANDDWGRFLRIEERDGRQEQVMMDAKGPGAVVRIWSANPSGTLRIYLDGASTPVIEEKMEELLGGKVSGFPLPIAGVRARGYNLYFPIAYAKSCKITCDQDKPYYIVNYRTYASGTPVQSFTRTELPNLAAEIRDAAAKMAHPYTVGIAPDKTVSFEKTLQPGASADLAALKGSRAVTRFTVRPTADDVTAALRGVVVRMSFDGQQTVEAPLGDFFGAAPGLNVFETLPLGGTEQGELWSHWVMPFRRDARIQVVNMGKAPVTLQGQVGSAPYQWTPRTMHFSAGYNSRYDLKTRPFVDLNHLQVQGKGVFAGLSLAVDNPVRAWWGEGDEKVYVDGEKFPSWFGTGTEDYFGYAWCDTGYFTHAYHAQPCTQNGPGNYGRYSNNRFHIMDRIPFNQSLKFDMELWHWEDRIVNMATVAYWYAIPGAKDQFAAIKPADLELRPMPEYQPFKVAGAIEGETMEVLERTGVADGQDWAGLSGERQLWWRQGPKVGDTLRLRFNVPAAGTYRVVGRFLKARDYGIHQLAINGQKAGNPIDFYNPDVAPTEELDLGTHTLKAGANELTVTVTGANPRADKQYMFGLDYLKLAPVAR